MLPRKLEKGEGGLTEDPLFIPLAAERDVFHCPLQCVAIALTPGNWREIAAPHDARGPERVIGHRHERRNVGEAHGHREWHRPMANLPQTMHLDVSIAGLAKARILRKVR